MWPRPAGQRKRICELKSWNLHSALVMGNDWASLMSTLSAKYTDRMGSGCGGERLGQEMGKCANTAARHQRLRWDRPLSWPRSDSMMQRKRCRRPIQRIDWSYEVSPSTVSNLHLTQGCLGDSARLD